MLAFSVDRCHWYPCLCSSLFIKAAWYCLVFSEQSSTGHTKSVTYLGKYGGSWNHGSWRWVVFQKDVGCLDDGICHSRQKFASLLNYFISQIWTLFRTPENPMESHTNTIMSIPVHLSFAYHAFQPPAKNTLSISLSTRLQRDYPPQSYRSLSYYVAPCMYTNGLRLRCTLYF